MTTDDLYSNNNSVNMHILFCVKHFELSCYGHCTTEVLCIIIIISNSNAAGK